MAKRKSADLEGENGGVVPRRSARTSRPPHAAKRRMNEDKAHANEPTKKAKSSTPKAVQELQEQSKPESRTQAETKTRPRQRRPVPAEQVVTVTNGSTVALVLGEPPARNYWLMKAEPESRIENGIDVAFSIDHLAAKTAPEPWDGIRNYVARNNLRAMKKGDLSFFYHSNCKTPGIVGTMEIVQEHTPDLSAHDPKTAYYDPKSDPSDPRWSVVHVTFRRKFAVPIGLKELRELTGAGKPLENMQMLRQSRLSVSRVSAAEWEYLVGELEKREREAAAAEEA